MHTYIYMLGYVLTMSAGVTRMVLVPQKMKKKFLIFWGAGTNPITSTTSVKLLTIYQPIIWVIFIIKGAQEIVDTVVT